ncbi:hypothetical protein FE783_07230 [Paenibacillus mesophilus]|uniref:hypothetical protein n=1 Tax=Paenibacillus mesophilus TaxID=2582849 RepID=UPI00110D7CF5|nr:hypothetical protein [Paenibacillus mesophilus]TMV51558.1 hypothetical protein FE783_07230 [Paenibacillus mesophilus]
MSTRSGSMDPNRFASGIMGKYGFTRGNYLGRLSLVFKLQRELVQQVMRGAKSSDVMTNQWFIRLQQLQEAMPATPQVQKVIQETTRLLERVTVVQEAAQTNKDQLPNLSDHALDRKPDDRNSEARPDESKSGRNGRSRKKKAEQTTRSGESSSGSNESNRNSRNTAQDGKTDKEDVQDQPKRGRSSKRHKTNDASAARPEIETALPDKVKPAGKAVAVLRMKPFTNNWVQLKDGGDGSRRNRNLLSELHTQPAMKPLADRFSANGSIEFKPKQTRFGRQADRLPGSLFLQPFEMILRSTRKRTYIDSILDKQVRTFNPIKRNPTARNEPSGLHRTNHHERYAEQPARVNIEHNEGYSAEIIRPSGRIIGNPAKESKAPTGRTADSIRLSYKHPVPASSDSLAGEPARNDASIFTAPGMPTPITDNSSRPNQSLVVRRRLSSPFDPLIRRSADAYLWPPLGSDSSIGNLLPAMMPMVPRRRAADQPGHFAERPTAMRFALPQLSAIHRPQFSLNRAGASDNRPAYSKRNDRLTEVEELTGRLQPLGFSGLKVQGAGNVPTSDSKQATPRASRGAEARPESFEFPQRSHPVSRIVMRRQVQIHRGSDGELPTQSPFSKSAIMNARASDALRIMRKQFDTAYRSSSPLFALYPDRPGQRAIYPSSVDGWIEDAATKPGVGTVIRRANRTIPNRSGLLEPGIGAPIQQQSVKEEYNKPLRPVHRSLYTGEQRVPTISIRDSSYSNLKPIADPYIAPSSTGRPVAVRQDDQLSSSIATLQRTIAAEPIKKAADPIAFALANETPVLLKEILARHESGIQRLLLDPAVNADRGAKRMFPLIGEWGTDRENGDSFKSRVRWLPFDRRRSDRLYEPLPEPGENAADKLATRNLTSHADNRPLSVSVPLGSQAGKGRTLALHSIQKVIATGVRMENGEAADVPSVFRWIKSKFSTADLLHKRASRHLRQDDGVERSKASRQINPVYIPGMNPIPAPARLYRRPTGDRASTEPAPSAIRPVRQPEANKPGEIRRDARSRSPAVPGSGIIMAPTARSQAKPFTYGYTSARSDTAKIFRRTSVRDDHDRQGITAIPLQNRSGKLPIEQRVEENTRFQDDFRKLREIIRGESDGAAVKPAAMRMTAADPERMTPMADSAPSIASLRPTIGIGSPTAQTGDAPLSRSNQFGYPPFRIGLDKVSEYRGSRNDIAIRRSIASATDPIFGPVKNRVHRRLNEGSAGGIGTGDEIVRSGSAKRLSHSGTIEPDTVQAAGTLRNDLRNDRNRKRQVRTESTGPIRWNEDTPHQSGNMRVNDARIRNGLPILDRESGLLRRIGVRSAVPYESGRPWQANLSHLRRSSPVIEQDDSAPDSIGLSTGVIRRKANDINSVLGHTRKPVPEPMLQTYTERWEYPTNESGTNREDGRHQTPLSRLRPVILSNRLPRNAGDKDSSTASDRLKPLQRSFWQRADPSILPRSGDSANTDISALTRRYPGRERYGIGNIAWAGASSSLTIYRNINPTSYMTDKMGAGVPFDSGYTRDRTVGDKNGTERERIYTVRRKESPGSASVIQALSGSAAPEKPAFPYKWSGSDRKERDNQRLSGTGSSSSRLEAHHYRNRTTLHTNTLRTVVSPVTLQTLDRAVGESGSFTVLQRAASPLRGSADTIVHTIRDRIGTMQYVTTDKTRAGDKASTAGYRPERTRTAAATELRILRMSMASGTQALGTTRSGMAGQGPAVPERRVIAPQAAMALSAAPAQVLQLKVNEARSNAGMLPMEHKQRAAVPGVLGSDPADIDYRRQTKPAAPAETVSVIEPAPPQIDMAELQEMVMGLPQFDIKNITDRVYREIERKIRFDRQTRGL